MPAETYELWQPVHGVPARLNMIGLSHTSAGVEVCLQESLGEGGATLSLLFESPIAYRSINESYRLRTWNRLGQGDHSTFYRVHNSQWTKWLREEAGGVLGEIEIEHYAIFTDEYCVDIVTEFPPSASWSSNEECSRGAHDE